MTKYPPDHQIHLVDSYNKILESWWPLILFVGCQIMSRIIHTRFHVRNPRKFTQDHIHCSLIFCYPDMLTVFDKRCRQTLYFSEMCKPGYLSANGLSPCSPCRRGRYQHEYEQKSCIQCPIGLTTEKVASSSKSQCICKFTSSFPVTLKIHVDFRRLADSLCYFVLSRTTVHTSDDVVVSFLSIYGHIRTLEIRWEFVLYESY